MIGQGKDGMSPCEPCKHESLNPYIGAARCIDITQQQILQTFYDATNGDSWVNRESWTDDTIPMCQQEGNTCNTCGKVTRIVLDDHNLSGTLPREVGFLDRLVELDISGNTVQGTIPEELALAPLLLLDVSANKFTEFVPGALCRKTGINGNGRDKIYSCDVIACPMGAFDTLGRADPGFPGVHCQPCIQN